MKTIEVERIEWAPTEKQQRVEPPPEGAVIAEPDTRLEADGELVAVITKLGPELAPELAWLARALAHVRWQAAHGRGDEPRLSGIRVAHRPFGYVAAQPLRRRYAASSSLFNREEPEIAASLERMAGALAERFAAVAPEEWADHRDLVESVVLPDWRWGGAPWTSGIINRTKSLPYHRDAGNLKGSWSAQITLRSRTEGGLLHLPEYGAYLEVGNGSLAIFPGGQLWHGVTPIEVGRRGWRYSIVYYAKSAMRRALPMVEEVRQAGMKRAEAEGRMAETVRERLAAAE